MAPKDPPLDVGAMKKDLSSGLGQLVAKIEEIKRDMLKENIHTHTYIYFSLSLYIYIYTYIYMCDNIYSGGITCLTLLV